MINHSTVKDSNGRRGAKSGHDLEEEAAEAAREEEIETAPEAGQQGASMTGPARQPGEGRGRSRGGRPGVAGYGDGRARRGGLAWRATATATGERAEAAWRGGQRRRAAARRRPWGADSQVPQGIGAYF